MYQLVKIFKLTFLEHVAINSQHVNSLTSQSIPNVSNL